MQTKVTPAQLAQLVQSRRRLNTRLASLFSVVAVALAVAMLYNIYKIDQPWIRFGQAWTLCVFAWMFVAAAIGGRRKIDLGQSSAEFLLLQHEERRRGYLLIRSRLFLLLPGFAACWWGERSLGATRSPWLAWLNSSPWFFLPAVGGLILVWFALGQAAEKAVRDRNEILCDIGKAGA